MSSENSFALSKPDRFIATLESLLALAGANVAEAIQQAAQLVTQALGAEKVDVFLYDPSSESLTALGTSTTPMGTKQKAIGLDHLPLSNGGHVAWAYQMDQHYRSGQAHLDPSMLPGMKKDLGIKSEMIVPLHIETEHRGVLFAASSRPDYFTEEDLHFLDAVAHWVGVLIHRAELAEQRTREATAQARRLAAEDILTVMAHDLHNYLTPLKGRIDLLERRAHREKQEEYVRELEVISQGVRRLNRLMSDLLDAERLKQGLFSLDLQPMDLVALVEEVVPIWSMPEHPIQVRAPDTLLLTADRDRLQQVVENLLSNATTYAELGTPIQVVLTLQQRTDEPWAIMTISNQGPVMPSEQLSALFQPFVKGTRSQGLGLGLWLAQCIAHAHQGALTVQIEAEKTTHFTLALPLHTIRASS